MPSHSSGRSLLWLGCLGTLLLSRSAMAQEPPRVPGRMVESLQRHIDRLEESGHTEEAERLRSRLEQMDKAPVRVPPQKNQQLDALRRSAKTLADNGLSDEANLLKTRADRLEQQLRSQTATPDLSAVLAEMKEIRASVEELRREVRLLRSQLALPAGGRFRPSSPRGPAPLPAEEIPSQPGSETIDTELRFTIPGREDEPAAAPLSVPPATPEKTDR